MDSATFDDPHSGLLALARAEAMVIVGGVLIVVCYQIVTGRIPLRGLLRDKRTGAFSASRLQALLATFGMAGALFAGSMGDAGGGSRIGFAVEGPEFVVGLGASHFVYLWSKSRPPT